MYFPNFEILKEVEKEIQEKEEAKEGARCEMNCQSISEAHPSFQKKEQSRRISGTQ